MNSLFLWGPPPPPTATVETGPASPCSTKSPANVTTIMYSWVACARPAPCSASLQAECIKNARLLVDNGEEGDVADREAPGQGTCPSLMLRFGRTRASSLVDADRRLHGVGLMQKP